MLCDVYQFSTEVSVSVRGEGGGEDGIVEGGGGRGQMEL